MFYSQGVESFNWLILREAVQIRERLKKNSGIKSREVVKFGSQISFNIVDKVIEMDEQPWPVWKFKLPTCARLN